MKLLICYDGSDKADAALDKSIMLFAHLKPEIILVTVVEEPLDASSNVEDSFEQLRKDREAELRNAALKITEHGLEADAILAIGDPRKMLVEAVRKRVPDILVITSRPPKGGVRFGNVTVSVSDYLLHHIDICPVLVMH
ncbi:MAG: universal stress protein [Betaproteobacteria bacterium]|nr:universal stress protein [Betaproteobacteria bacterium]